MRPLRLSIADDRTENEALGRALARGRRSRSVNVSDLHLITSRERAEAVQEEAALAYGSPIEGHTMAATTTLAARLLNCEAPVMSPMFASERIDDGGHLDVTPTLLGIGAELQFRLGRAFPLSGDDPDSLDSVRDAIVACHPGLQILGRRFGHGVPMNAWTALADFGLAAHHVRGRSLTGWRDLDLRTLDMSMTIDGTIVATGHGGDTLGDPIAAVSWLARTLASRGLYLEAGSFVAIGSCTGLTQLVAGHTYAGVFGTGAEVRVRAV